MVEALDLDRFWGLTQPGAAADSFANRKYSLDLIPWLQWFEALKTCPVFAQDAVCSGAKYSTAPIHKPSHGRRGLTVRTGMYYLYHSVQ